MSTYRGIVEKVEEGYLLVNCEQVAGPVYVPRPTGWSWLFPPKVGMRVDVSGVYDTENGWRGTSASPVTPETFALEHSVGGR